MKCYEPGMQITSQVRQYRLGQSSCWLIHHLSGSLMMALMLCMHAEYCLHVVMIRLHGHLREQVVIVHCGQCPSLRSAMVLVATAVRMIVAMATTVAAAATATVTQEVALPRQSDVTGICDGNKARVYTADNAGASTAAKQFAYTQAALWRQMKAQALLGPLRYLEDVECGQQWPMYLCLLYIPTLSGLVARL